MAGIVQFGPPDAGAVGLIDWRLRARREASTSEANCGGSVIGRPRHGDMLVRSASAETMRNAPTAVRGCNLAGLAAVDLGQYRLAPTYLAFQGEQSSAGRADGYRKARA